MDRIQFEGDDLEYPRLVHEPFRPETLGRRPGEKAGDDYCDTLDEVAKKKPAELSAQQKVGAELVRQARERGLSLMGLVRPLNQLTKWDSS